MTLGGEGHRSIPALPFFSAYSVLTSNRPFRLAVKLGGTHLAGYNQTANDIQHAMYPKEHTLG